VSRLVDTSPFQKVQPDGDPLILGQDANRRSQRLRRFLARKDAAGGSCLGGKGVEACRSASWRMSSVVRYPISDWG
jgi:hypothetical protein